MGVTTGGFGLFAGGSGGGGSGIPSEDMSYGVASGTNTYSVTLSPAITEYTTGLFISVKFTNSNTSTTPTLNCDSLGAKNIVSINSSALYGNQIVAGGVYNMVYDGTNLVLLNSTPSKDIRIVNETATGGTTITGVTTNEIAYSFEIPANTFTVGNNPQFFLRNLYTGSAGTKTTRFYLNSSDSISGASLIGTVGASATNVVSVDISRSFSIKSSTITQVYSPTTSNFSIQASATSPIAEYNINWTASVWIIVAIQLASGADSAVNSYFKLTL